MMVSADDQVKTYIKKIMSQLNRWMQRGKISKLVIVITDKDTGEHVERWQFDIEIFGSPSKSSKSKSGAAGDENASSKSTTAAAPEEEEEGISERTLLDKSPMATGCLSTDGTGPEPA